MRTILTLLVLVTLSSQLRSQSNTFPSTGNAGIGNTSPPAPLTITKNGVDDLGSSPRSILQLLNGSSGKGLYLGYDNSEQLGTIYPQGSSSGIAFWSHNGSSWGERMRIHTNGNVGIGTTNVPSDRFVVQGANSTSATEFGNTSSGINYLQSYDRSTTAFKSFEFFTSGSSATLHLDASGNVGIGTSTPGYRIEAVSGSSLGFRLQTNNSSVAGPLMDLYDNGRAQESIISSTDGTVTGMYIATYTNHPLLFSTNHSSAQVVLTTQGNMGVGLTSPTEKLSVNGNVSAKKIIVTQTGWSDYVFNDNYELRPLSQVARYIKQYKHLPEIPSVRDVIENGVSVGDNQALLLKKIEELTLYLIQLEKKVDKQAKDLEKLKAKG